LHIDSAEKTRTKLRADKERAKSGSVLTFAFDLQKTNPLPYLVTNEAYYKKTTFRIQLRIHNCSTDTGHFHMWHEATASRGPSEIASVIWQWLNQMKDKDMLKKEVVAYSDSCDGQNRNIVISQ